LQHDLKSILIAAVALSLGIGTAIAGNADHSVDKKGSPPGFSEGNKTGWDNGNEPPGWDNGQRQGFNNEDDPPGLQKNQMFPTTERKTISGTTLVVIEAEGTTQ
jgi:hypothetical protein